MISFCLPAGPTIAVRIVGLSSSDISPEAKSAKDGPALSRSLKVVGERRVDDVGGAVGSVGSDTAVANVRVGNAGDFGLSGGASKQRNRVAFEAILKKYQVGKARRTWRSKVMRDDIIFLRILSD